MRYMGEEDAATGEPLYVRVGGPPDDWSSADAEFTFFLDDIELRDIYVVAADAYNGFIVFYRKGDPDKHRCFLAGKVRIAIKRPPAPKRESTRNPLDYNRNGTM